MVMTVTALEIELYEFSELDPSVQDKVLENYRDINLDEEGYWMDGIISSWEEELARCGWLGAKVKSSGIYHLYEGVMFEAELDERVWLEYNYGENDPTRRAYEELLEHPDLGLSFKLHTKGGRYYDENYNEVVFKLEWEDETEIKTEEEYELWLNLAEEWCSEMGENRRELCFKILADLKAEFDYQLTDEAVERWIEDTGLMFTENGKPDYS